VLTASSKLQNGWVAGATEEQDGGFKNERGKFMDVLGKVI